MCRCSQENYINCLNCRLPGGVSTTAPLYVRSRFMLRIHNRVNEKVSCETSPETLMELQRAYLRLVTMPAHACLVASKPGQSNAKYTDVSPWNRLTLPPVEGTWRKFRTRLDSTCNLNAFHPGYFYGILHIFTLFLWLYSIGNIYYITLKSSEYAEYS